MRFDCGETWPERRARLENWHLFFAWYPVKIKDHDCAWLERVLRKGKWDCNWGESTWTWSYSPIGAGLDELA